MMKSHRFRLYPNKDIEERMLKILDVCRHGYNFFLSEFNNWDNISYEEMSSMIPNLKICDDMYKEPYSKSLQHECKKLFNNLSALHELKNNGHKVGRLRFKGKNWFKSFTYNQSGFRLDKIGKRCDRLWLSKIGYIKIRCHRKIQGNIKQIVIKHESSGKWYASLIEELPDVKKHKLCEVLNDKIIGIDLGLIDVVYDSDGNKTANPKHLKSHAKRLAHIQRIFSKKKKGSSNRNKYRIKLACAYEKLVNSRDDFLHKLSRYYVDRYEIIGFEDMCISSFVEDHPMAKYMLDASWGKLREYVYFKAERAGNTRILVDTWNTTQMCNKCKKFVYKSLKDRLHACPHCGLKMSRDFNSAIEIKYRTIQRITEIGKGLAKSTPVEMKALLSNKQLSSMKQEATSLNYETI